MFAACLGHYVDLHKQVLENKVLGKKHLAPHERVLREINVYIDENEL